MIGRAPVFSRLKESMLILWGSAAGYAGIVGWIDSLLKHLLLFVANRKEQPISLILKSEIWAVKVLYRATLKGIYPNA